MKFYYKKVAPELIRPIIPVELKFNGNSVPCEVLIDSGADFCIFHKEIAEILGIELTKGKPASFAGISGDKATMHLHQITVVVGGWSHKITAGFSKDIGPYGYGIVGQRGFFDKFIVKFDYQKGVVEVVPK